MKILEIRRLEVERARNEYFLRRTAYSSKGELTAEQATKLEEDRRRAFPGETPEDAATLEDL